MTCREAGADYSTGASGLHRRASNVIWREDLRSMPDRIWSHDCWSFWFDTTKNAEEDALFEQFQKRFLKVVPNLNDLTGTT